MKLYWIVINYWHVGVTTMVLTMILIWAKRSQQTTTLMLSRVGAWYKSLTIVEIRVSTRYLSMRDRERYHRDRDREYEIVDTSSTDYACFSNNFDYSNTKNKSKQNIVIYNVNDILLYVIRAITRNSSGVMFLRGNNEVLSENTFLMLVPKQNT